MILRDNQKSVEDERPLVSVVMSVFDEGDYISESVESVLSQSFSNLELIVVDDGSTSSQVSRILREYADSDDRVLIIRKPNEGLTKALIDGCQRANGDFIARIDNGDVMLPDRIEKQLALLEQDESLSMVSSWTSYHSPVWESLWTSRGEAFGTYQKQLIGEPKGDVSHHGAVMFRRTHYQQVGGYRWQFYYGQDWDLWYRLRTLGGHGVVPEVLYKARVFPASISMTQKCRQEKIASLSYQASQALNSSELANLLADAAKIRPAVPSDSSAMTPHACARGNYFIGKLLFDRRDAGCRKYFYRAFLEKPWTLKYLMVFFLSKCISMQACERAS